MHCSGTFLAEHVRGTYADVQSRAEKSINRILAIATAPVEPPVDEPEMPQGPSPTSARLEKQPSLKELIK